MMWLSLVARYWKQIAGAALILTAGWYLHHRGFESGYAASEAKWQPLFAAAAKARDAANEKARRQEESSNHISQTAEAEHAKTVAFLNLRAADAERNTAGLMRQLTARARCSSMSQAGSAPAVPDAAAASDRIADRASKDLVELARRCESDGRTLAELQSWVTAQRAILTDSRSPPP